MNLEGMDKEVLGQYVEMRKDVTKRVDRVVALMHLLELLKYCPDDTVEVCPMALSVVADLVDSDVTSIQEMLDGFIYIVEAEEAIDST
jgi:hypothetical protein